MVIKGMVSLLVRLLACLRHNERPVISPHHSNAQISLQEERARAELLPTLKAGLQQTGIHPIGENLFRWPLKALKICHPALDPKSRRVEFARAKTGETGFTYRSQQRPLKIINSWGDIFLLLIQAFQYSLTYNPGFCIFNLLPTQVLSIRFR
jgi:hypothetical protein